MRKHLSPVARHAEASAAPVPSEAIQRATRVFPKARAIGDLHDDAVTICVHEAALDAILDDAERDTRRERGGFLVGKFIEGTVADGRGAADRRANNSPGCVVIRRYLAAADARGHAASLRFAHEAWSAARREIESRFPDERIVGWHHTHPNLGAFLSGYDLFIQRSFFAEPWQVALVVDPVRHELRFHQWRRGEIVDCGFVCVPDESPCDHSVDVLVDAHVAPSDIVSGDCPCGLTGDHLDDSHA